MTVGPETKKATVGSEPQKAAVCCTFCGTSAAEREKVVAGPGVYICNCCIGLCQELLDDTSSVPKLKPWEMSHSLEEILAILPQLAASRDKLEADLAEWVGSARRLGATWARIGEALGMSRQSAWERFSGEE